MNKLQTFIEQTIKPAFDLIDDFVFLVGHDQRILYCNDAVIRKLHYSREEVSKMNVLDFHPESQREQAAQIISAMLQGTEKFCPIPLIDKSENKVPVETRVSLMQVEGETLIFIVSKDLTMQVEVEGMLKSQQDKFYTVFHDNPNLMALSDISSGEYIEVNQAFLSFVGRKREDVIGKKSSDLGLMPPEIRKKIMEVLNKKKFLKDIELEIPDSDNRKRKMLFHASIIAQKPRDILLTVAVDISEKENLNDALKDSERKWHFALGGADLGIWDWNTETNEVFLSTRWKSMLGYEEEDISANVSEWASRIHPEDKEKTMANLNRLLTGKKSTYEDRHRLLCKNGQYKWILDKGKILSRNDKGEPLRIIGTHTDISQIVTYQESLRFRAKFEHAINSISSAFINIPLSQVNRKLNQALKETGQVMKVDRAYLFLYNHQLNTCSNTHEWCGQGISPEKENLQDIPNSAIPWWHDTLESKGFIRYNDINDLPTEAVEERAILEAQKIKSVVVVALRRKGVLTGFIGFDAVKQVKVWDENIILLLQTFSNVLVNALDLYQSEQQVRNYQKTLENRVRMQTRKLEVANARLVHQIDKIRLFETALEHSANAILITDEKFHIQYVNPSCCRETGYTQKELLGETPRIFISGLQEASFYQTMNSVITKGKVFTGKFQNRTKDGTIIVVNQVISPVMKGGIISHYIGIRQNITKEENLQKELFQSEKLRALGTLAGGIAHDFNNILQIISIHRDLISIMNPSSDSAEALEQIRAATFRGKTLVKNILTFSRKDQGQKQLYPVFAMFEEAIEFVTVLVPSYIQFHSRISREQMYIKTDKTQVQQILMNLISNAADAAGNKGTIDLTVDRVDKASALNKKHKKGWCRIIIHDNGPGISPEHQKKIFEPFFSTKEVGKGTGMGLSTIYGIVKDHKGLIEVESTPGQGATFTVYLPLS